MERKVAPKKGPRCLGRWCPGSLDKINQPGFVLRGGVIPYIPSTIARDGKILLGMKINGNYTDFGGGCKIRKKETPFDCAKREFLEETLGVVTVNPKNITHILITGTKQPHQMILMIKVDETVLESAEENYATAFEYARKPELSRLEVFSLRDFAALQKHQISESLYSLHSDIERIVRGPREKP
jgi:hypothetical protein